jgi:hypothetical protein
VRRGAACAAHSNTVRYPSGVVGAQGVRTPTVPWSPCPRPASASACPASTRPASTPSGACPASTRPVRPSGVQCLVSDVRCPLHASGIGASCVRVHAVHAGELVERVGAADSSTDRTCRIGRGATVSATGARPSPPGTRWRWLGGLPGRREQQVAHQDRPSVGKCVGLAHRWQAARRSAGACGRPQTWVVGRPGRDALGPIAPGCAAPPRPKGSSSPPRSRQTGRGNPV